MRVFEDTWRWDQASAAAFHKTVEKGGTVADALEAFQKFLGNNDMLAYLSMMAPRLVELRRVLKDTGSIYLHCDQTANHYLKMLMDAVFEPRNFRNEIIWKRTFSHGGARRYGPVHDTLLFYTKTDDYVWKPKPMEYSEKYKEDFFTFEDQDGKRYRHTILTGPGVRSGSSGKPWRGIDPTKSGRHWAIPGFLRPRLGDPPPATVQEALDRLEEIGRIAWPKKKGGTPSLKQYLDDMPGVDPQDIWIDIPPLTAKDSERLGYPTQKPVALLERIIEASSHEGSLLLDPFCGCGTTIAAAQKLNRQWIGIDITHLAVTLIRHRLRTAYGDSIEKTYKVEGAPEDLESARVLAGAKDRYQFQWWALSLVGARPAPTERKKGADAGVDGRLKFFTDRSTKGTPEQILFSVKSGGVGVSDVRDLVGAVTREKAAIGVLISLQEPTEPMRRESASGGFYTSKELGDRKYPRIQLLTVEELLAGRRVDCPPFAQGEGNVTLKRAPRVKLPALVKGRAAKLGDFKSKAAKEE